jgi:hypothetical protein
MPLPAPRLQPGLQPAPRWRWHPYPCRPAARGAWGRLGPAVGWWLGWGFALVCLLALAYAVQQLNGIEAERRRFEYCTNVRLGVLPESRDFRLLCERPKSTPLT